MSDKPTKKTQKSMRPQERGLILYTTHRGSKARELAGFPKPAGPAFDPETVKNTDSLQVWCTPVRKLGKDYSIFLAFDKKGERIGESLVKGY